MMMKIPAQLTVTALLRTIGVRDGRRAMLVILALIILVIFDVWTLNEMRKHEIAIVELLKKNGMITRRDTDDD